jgi:hypothetical protein
MTEAEWLASSEPRTMLQLVSRSSSSERKVRLFNAAICRRFWDYLPEASKAILLQSELLADGLVQPNSDEPDLCGLANEVVYPFDQQYPNKQFPSREIRVQRDAAAAVCYAVLPNELWGAAGYIWDIDPAEKEAHSILIRDVFGNPFRPSVAINPAWLSWNGGTVQKIAQAIYDERAFDHLPVLADALEEAGCDNGELLAHCRSEGPHVKGCWAVDLILGRP